MTHIAKAPYDEVERAKWRHNAEKAAAHLKSVKSWGEQQTHLAAFVFDDGLVKLPINVSLIHKLSEQALADWIFNTVLEVQEITPAGGESAGADQDARGTEAGLAAAQAPAVTGNAPRLSSSSNEPEQPAAAAVVEPCMRRLEPDFTEPCPNHATGGLRITLRPAEAVEKRWGLGSLLTFLMPVTLCPSCFPKVHIMEITDPELRARLGKTAQQGANGVLVDWKRTVIEQVPFDDPQYMALVGMLAKREQPAANDAAGPPKEAA